MKTSKQILKPLIWSYWDSHQFENSLYEEGEYVKLEDAEEAMIKFAKLHVKEALKVVQMKLEYWEGCDNIKDLYPLENIK